MRRCCQLIAEIEFHKPVDPANSSAPTLLSGTVYGTDPASGNSLSLRYPKAFDGITTTGFKYGRPSQGIAGIDLGAGNESHVGKIRFMPRSGTNTPAMAAHIGLRFVAMIEQPEIVEVLQRVETTDGRAVNYLNDTHLDTSIGQSHLVFAGVDYDGDLQATSPGEARFTWTTAQQGTGPVIAIHNEPRSTRKEKQLKFEYVSPAVGTKGMITRVAHATTNETILANDPQNVRTLTTPGGRLTKMAYTSASPGNFGYVTSAAGHKTDFSWNAQRFLAGKTDAAGRATTFTWNAIGKRTSVTRPDGLVQTASFDASGRVTGKSTTAAGLPTRTTGFTLDSVGKVTRTDYPDSSYETFTYNSLGLVTQKRQRDATLTTATYSATGLLLTVTTATGTALAETTSHTYYGANDPSGSPARMRKSTTDPRGRTTSWEYDDRGLVTRTTYADGSSRLVAYDANANQIMESDMESKKINGAFKILASIFVLVLATIIAILSFAFFRPSLLQVIGRDDADGMKILLDNGLSPDHILFPDNSRKHTPMLQYAIMNGSYKIVNILLERGASPASTDALGNTPIMSVFVTDELNETEQRQVFDLLIQKSNLDHRNKNGHAALDYGIKYGSSYVRDRLQRP